MNKPSDKIDQYSLRQEKSHQTTSDEPFSIKRAAVTRDYASV